MDMFLAGLDSTSFAAGFALYHLARNMQAQEILRKEIMQVLPSKNSSITPDALALLPYLKACVKETMR